MSDPEADRNLLFSILATRTGLITRETLDGAMSARAATDGRTIGDLLVESGALGPTDRADLDSIVDRRLARSGGDVSSVLDSLTTVGGPASDLLGSTADDPYATRAPIGDLGAFSAPNHAPSGVRYRKVRDHAKGGLGVVFVAHDSELNRDVALKEIQDRHADNAGSRARFLLEAEITGGLEHPGIVPVYGLGRYDDGRPFYAMRFIRGDSLKEAIAAFHASQAANADTGTRSLGLRKLLGRFLDVCNAVDYAHSRGVVHRDLKPDNVMVGKYGETLVVDWGLAKALGRLDVDGPTGTLDEASLSPSNSGGSDETLPGSVVGTPAYMSPEQADGRLDLLGPPSDVYSLGATLYSLLTGKPPVSGKPLVEILADVRDGRFPRPREVARWLDPALEAVCLKAMALRPEDRYASPRALGEDLERWLADEPVGAFPEPWTRRAVRWTRRHRMAVTVGSSTILVVALAIGAFAWLARERTRRADGSALASLSKADRLRAEARASGDLARWEAAADEAKVAEAQIDSGGGSAWARLRVAAELDEILAEGRRVRATKAALEKDRKVVTDLEEARPLRAESSGHVFDPRPQHEAFLRAFRDYGIDIATQPIEEAARRVKSSPVAVSLVAALDEWAFDEALLVPVERLREIIRLADPDPAMTALRDASNRKDADSLRKLVEGAKSRPDWAVRTLPFVHSLTKFDPTASRPLLELIRRERPGDFWTNHSLAEAFEFGRPRRLDEAVRYYSVASALRPGSASILVNLGTALRLNGDPDGAIAAQREAIRLRPDLADAHIGLGNALADKGDFDGSIRALREAIRLRPDSGMAYNNLGNALGSRKDLEGALAAYRESARLGYSIGHYSLGCALRNKPDLDGSVKSLREACRLMPEFWKARYMLGNVLMDRQDWAGAIEAYRESLRLNPHDSPVNYLLGNCLRNQGLLDEAVAAFRESLRVWPDNAEAHCNLGLVLMRQGFATEALKHLERGHELGSMNPQWSYPSAEWVANGRRAVALEAKVSAIRKGEAGPIDPSEALTLAEFCYDRKLFATSARLLAKVFDDRPDLASNLGAGHRYNAARTASLAGSGQGKDDPSPSEDDRRRLRDQARGWLRADLVAMGKLLDGGNPSIRPTIVRAMDHWKRDPDLAGIRDEAIIATLPEAERQDGRSLWLEVEALRIKAVGTK